jgi:hypothetical protein
MCGVCTRRRCRVVAVSPDVRRSQESRLEVEVVGDQDGTCDKGENFRKYLADGGGADEVSVVNLVDIASFP